MLCLHIICIEYNYIHPDLCRVRQTHTFTHGTEREGERGAGREGYEKHKSDECKHRGQSAIEDFRDMLWCVEQDVILLS